MASINIFVPGFSPRKFSGGLLAVFEYANGLTRAGHNVRVIPMEASPSPEWFRPEFELLNQHGSTLKAAAVQSLQALLKADKALLKNSVKGGIDEIVYRLSRWSSYIYRRARQIHGLRGLVPPSDVTIATSYHTALPVYLYGSGAKFYFCQHYEPYFDVESDFPELARIDALSTYFLPENSFIANSSWLSSKLRELTCKDVPVCTNAIDHTVYFPEGDPPDHREKFVVVSYGGRLARWKGFQEAAEAIRIARQSIPHLEWRVFGDALLPPNNSIASYVPLGFITGQRLRRAYSEAHILLSTSWYESFPLYPLEAMACGAAVVTTPYGTEDYAQHLFNAYVVPPRDPEAAARALLHLYEDAEMRSNLAKQGLVEAKKHTWEKSVQRMQSLLFQTAS